MGKMHGKALALIALMLVLVLAGTACASGAPSSAAAPDTGSAVEAAPADSTAPAGSVDIRFAWWGGEARTEATLAMVDKFIEQNPNYTIECEPGSWDTFWQKLVVQLASADAPDICQTDYQFCAEILKLDKPFVNMDDLEDIIDTSNILEVDPVYLGEEGYSYGIPVAVNALALFANTEFMEKWGMDPERIDYTYQELMEIAQEIRSQDPESYMIYYPSDCLSYMFNDVIKGRTGVNVFNDEDFTLNVAAEDFTAFYEFFKQLIDTGTLAPIETHVTYGASNAEQVPGWQSGNIGMTVAFNSNLSTTIPGSEFEIKTLRYPYEKDAVDLGNALVPATLLSISKDSPYIEECAEFINWFLNDDEAIRMHGTVRGLPANTRAADMLLEAGEILPQVQDTITYAEEYHGTARSKTEADSEIKKAYLEIMYQVGYGEITPEAAGQLTVDTLEALLEEMRA